MRGRGVDVSKTLFYVNIMELGKEKSIMKRYGYHRTSTKEQHLDRGRCVDVVTTLRNLLSQRMKLKLSTLETVCLLSKIKNG